AHQRHALDQGPRDRAPQDPLPRAGDHRGDRSEAARRRGKALERAAQAARGGSDVPARVFGGAGADADPRAGGAPPRDHRRSAGPQVRGARGDREAEDRLPRDLQGAGGGAGEAQETDGGRGQYGDCWIRIAPMPRGSGFQFLDEIVGGVIPRQYIPAVERGIQEAAARGPVAGYPVVDFKVELYDGSYHDVDSNEMSFKMA